MYYRYTFRHLDSLESVLIKVTTRCIKEKTRHDTDYQENKKANSSAANRFQGFGSHLGP